MHAALGRGLDLDRPDPSMHFSKRPAARAASASADSATGSPEGLFGFFVIGERRSATQSAQASRHEAYGALSHDGSEL